MRRNSFTRIDFNEHLLKGPCSTSMQQSRADLSLRNCLSASRIKDRSGLATAAGFTGLALIFSRFSLAPLIWAQFPQIFDVSQPDEAALATLFFILIPVPGLLAPVALWLGLKAWLDLKQHSNKSGKIPAGFALLIGFVGTLILLSEIYQVTRALTHPI